MLIIRPMEPNELDSVLILFEYYRAEADITEEKYSQDRVLKTVKEYSIRPNLFFRVAYAGLRPVGLIGGFLSQDPVEDEITATIQFNYIIPDYATIDNYSALIDSFTEWSQQFSVSQIRALDIGNRFNRLQSVYDELDFNPVRVSIMNKEIA